MASVTLDFSAMEKAVGGPVTYEKTMTGARSPYTEGQSWEQGRVTVNGLTYGLTLVYDTETGLVLGVIDGIAPGMDYSVVFTDVDTINGRGPSKYSRKTVEELFNPDYHYREHGDGRDTRSATERFGRLD